MFFSIFKMKIKKKTLLRKDAVLHANSFKSEGNYSCTSVKRVLMKHKVLKDVQLETPG